MNIAGSGRLPGGEYNEEISISGSGKIKGSAACTEFSISGSGKVEGDLTCSEKFKISGSGKVEGGLLAPEVSVSGSGKVADSIRTGKCHVSGSLHAGSIDCNELHVSGSVRTDVGISAEDVVVHGGITCGGLLNAERIEVVFNGGSSADAIGGSSVKIRRRGPVAGVFAILFGGKQRALFQVAGRVEGDILDLEYLTAEAVVGREVYIGPGCDIGRVIYSETVEISPDAIVGSCEQNA